MVCLSVTLLRYRITCLQFCNKRFCNKKGGRYLCCNLYRKCACIRNPMRTLVSSAHYVTKQMTNVYVKRDLTFTWSHTHTPSRGTGLDKYSAKHRRAGQFQVTSFSFFCTFYSPRQGACCLCSLKTNQVTEAAWGPFSLDLKCGDPKAYCLSWNPSLLLTGCRTSGTWPNLSVPLFLCQ